MVSQAVSFCPEHRVILASASSQRNLFSPFLLFLQTCFVGFFVSAACISPDCLYFLPPQQCLDSFLPPTDITTWASKNQSSCSFSSQVFTTFFGHLSLALPSILHFLYCSLMHSSFPFLFQDSALFSLSDLITALDSPSSEVPHLPPSSCWYPDEGRCFQGCRAAPLRSKSYMQFRFFPLSLNASYLWISALLPLYIKEPQPGQGLGLWGCTT